MATLLNQKSALLIRVKERYIGSVYIINEWRNVTKDNERQLITKVLEENRSEGKRGFKQEKLI